MISVNLARELRDAGLRWEPASGDQFVIPDRDLDDRVFSISEMTIDVRSSPVGRLIAFNGTVEWALDSIMQREVIWMPSEGQLRDLLGDRFIALERVPAGLRCVVDFDGHRMEYVDANAANAYGRAVLHWLLHRTPAEIGSSRG
ncbi:MAG: pilus assembly protein CpaE [Actinobacteria bacterium]|nr:pilus assembly protein CpaE [Actinomycetota bacterium]